MEGLEHKVESNLELDQRIVTWSWIRLPVLQKGQHHKKKLSVENQDLICQMRRLRVHWLLSKRARSPLPLRWRVPRGRGSFISELTQSL